MWNIRENSRNNVKVQLDLYLYLTAYIVPSSTLILHIVLSCQTALGHVDVPSFLIFVHKNKIMVTILFTKSHSNNKK